MSLRPPSSAGSTATTTTITSSSLPPPKFSQSKHSAASNIALFLSNLRLLDLDKRPDWPDVTVRTFDPKDALQTQKKRISCVEWILFRLFQLLDPEMAKDKLQPFFPSLEPLQSINLRAALFRCFNELRKNGVLGREVVLRKTMLDECKGEKFEEMLLVFSSLVLRRRLLSKQQGNGIPTAERLGMAQIIKPADAQRIGPLVLAHRVSLDRALRRREAKTALFKAFDRTLKSELHRVKQHHEEIKATELDLGRDIPLDTTANIRTDLQRNWVGPTEGSQVLLDGTSVNSSETLSGMEYSEALEIFAQSGSISRAVEEPSLLQQFEDTLTEQNIRLEMWRKYGKQMRGSDNSSEAESHIPEQTVSMKKADSLFSQHQSIRIGQVSLESSDLVCGDFDSPYEDLVMNMTRRISFIADRRQRERSGLAKVLAPIQRQSSISETAPPSSISRNMPLFRATSQRKKFDFFSPLKGGVYLPDSPSPQLVPDQSASPVRSSHTPSASSNDTIKQTDEVCAGIQPPSDHGWHGTSSPVLEDRSGQGYTPSFTGEDHLDTNSRLPSLEELPSHGQGQTTVPHPSLDKSLPSLAERTRMSMALDGTEDQGLLPSSSTPSPQIKLSESTSSGMSSINRRISLADRTRQTMASVPHKPNHNRWNPRREVPTSYPVNQFETPMKSKPIGNAPITPSGTSTQARLDTTPTDRLFSKDAEYESVFKSRPRIAASPVLSPMADDMTHVPYHDDADFYGSKLASSPLGAMNDRWRQDD